MEEDKETQKSEVEVDGLGLIEFASEDDSLLFSSFLDPTSYEFSEADADEKCLNDDKDQSLLRDDTQNCDEEILVSTVEEKEGVLQPHESPEPEKVAKKSGKYNLRKSLAWDNAFFTSAGVLEPEELSSMMESNHKSERKALPTIEEDINRSTESISTFQSDCNLENSKEFVLFEDVRASIQRSAAATPAKNNDLEVTEVPTSPTPSAVDVVASQVKMKSKASPKKLGIRVQGLGKATKQPVATRGLSPSISMPPNGLNKVRSLPISTNRTSLDISKIKQEKNSRLPTGKEPLGPRIPISRSARPTLPKPAVVKSTLRTSAASKNELTSSCSSLESCASASSSSSNKSSLDSIKKKNDSSSRLASQSLTNRSTSRGVMGQPRIPPHPTNKTSKSKLSSSVRSSAGSISDCSSESSRASATSRAAKGKQKTVSGEKGPSNDNTVQTVKPIKNSKDSSLVQADAKESTKRVSAINGGLVSSASTRPSGLRVPSPKIGFFDGARNGSSPSASKKSGKSQIQESPNSKSKASSRLVFGSTPKPQNKLYSKINAEDQLEG